MDKKEKPDYVIEPDFENKITIIKSDNGFFIKYYEQLSTMEKNEPPTYRERYYTLDEDFNRYEVDEDLEKEITDEEKAMHKLLYFIKNHFGLSYNKHKSVNLTIEFEDFREESPSRTKEKKLKELVKKLYTSSMEICKDYASDILEDDFSIIKDPYDELMKLMEWT